MKNLASSQALSESLVESALALSRVLSRKSLADTNWQESAHLSPEARHWLYETLRHYALVQDCLIPLLRNPPPEAKNSTIINTKGYPPLLPDDRVEALLYIAFTILSAGRHHPAMVVDEAVKAVRKLPRDRQTMGVGDKVVNGVLRAFLRQSPSPFQPDRHKTALHPAWWYERINRQFGQEAIPIFSADNLRPPMSLRVNLAKTTLVEGLALLSSANISATPVTALCAWQSDTKSASWVNLPSGEISAINIATPVAVEAIPQFSEGLFSVQDAAPQRAIHHLQLSDSRLRVLDACAAPGGKSGHIAETLIRLHKPFDSQPSIHLIALEKDRARSERIIENRERLGYPFDVVVGDLNNPHDWWDGMLFDRILLDVPCTASGTVRRHPDSKWLLQPHDAKKQSHAQCQMLSSALQLLSPKGILVYSTCSLFPEENQEVVERVMNALPQTPLNKNTANPEQSQKKSTQLPKTTVNPSILTPQQCYQVYSEWLLPTATHDGHFFAVFSPKIKGG